MSKLCFHCFNDKFSSPLKTRKWYSLKPPLPISQVFAITSVFSVVAYLWLLIILKAVTPDVVDIWEAAVTFGFFPLLVLLAWLAERNFCGVPSKTETSKQMELGSFEPGESKWWNRSNFDAAA